MRVGLDSLTEREKETLRLLLAGHDAKSAARAQGLSVHTVNERLRDVRRKLAVTSSREAARLLAEAVRADPEFVADKQFGVVERSRDMPNPAVPDRRQPAGHRLAWLGGGMIVMSLVIAAIALSSALSGNGVADTQAFQRSPAAASVPAAAETAGAAAAREWVALVDGRRWDESWRNASDMFRAQVSTATWASQVQSVRQPLGAVTARALQSATRTGSLPGAPDGDYEVVQFQTDFAARSGAVETVVLVRESAGWKVAGYFIR
jgi:DNA-binding CsgD family transcriptional regulator